MSTIYLILGVIGWAACPIAIFAYVWAGRRGALSRGFEVDRDR